MGLIPSLDTPSYNAAERELLLQAARRAIAEGVAGRRYRPTTTEFPPTLCQPRATFVTLETAGELRGCIGSLEPRRPLIEDVIENAYAAAFHDPRFPPLTAAELDRLAVRLSVLSERTPLHFSSEDELLAQLRPGIDGLVLTDGHRRGTFLPVVWQSLPDRCEFWAQLKCKAGLSESHWSPTLRVERYTTESF